MSAPKLPPLPMAAAWELRQGKTDRVLMEITNNGARAHDWRCSGMETVCLYTADQMREMWAQGLEDAAKVCKEEEDRLWRAYKGHGEPSEKGNPHTEGASDQCAVLAEAIRRLAKEITP